jgi:hypothetical protein
MVFLRYLLLIAGFGLFIGAVAILVYDLYAIVKGRKPARDTPNHVTRPFPQARLSRDDREAPRSSRSHGVRRTAMRDEAGAGASRALGMADLSRSSAPILLL